MKKNKDFTYYGKQRLHVQRGLKYLDAVKYNQLYVYVPAVLLALLFDIETNFSFTFSTTGGILSLILFFYFTYFVICFVLWVVFKCLDKYYFKKRKELLEQYIKDKGIRNTIVGNQNE